MERDDFYLRSVASLHNIAGYHVLVSMLKSKREDLLDSLKLAKTQEEIITRALEFRIWDEVVKFLEREPQEAVNTLKEEGDPIYG